MYLHYVYTYMYICVHACIYLRADAYDLTDLAVCMCVYIYIYICIYIYMSIYIYICIFIYIYVCLYVYI